MAETLLQNAKRYLSDGDFAGAANSLAGVAEYYPWRYDLALSAGRLAFKAGNPHMAVQYLEQPGTLSHLTTEDLIMLGDAYNQMNDPLVAITIWKSLDSRDGSSQAVQRLADYYLQQKDYASAAISLQKLLQINPADIRQYYQLGLLYAATNPEKALPYLVQAAELDPVHASQAQSLHDSIRTALLSNETAYTYLVSGRQLANLDEWNLAAEAFHRATQLRPGYADAWAFLGEALGQIDYQDTSTYTSRGLTDLQLALRLDGSSLLANTFMGLYWERRQDYAQAQAYLEQAIKSNPQDPYLYSELGNILSRAGDLPAAQSAYQAAIQKNPQNPLFYRLLAKFAIENQIQIRELALTAARQALILDPNNADSLDVMAQVMLMLEDYHSAERYSRDAIQVNPRFSPAYLHLGTAYLYLGQGELARSWLKLACTIEPDSWVAAQATRMLSYYFP
jgi:tetratricopeptide (TPR) repeat protein